MIHFAQWASPEFAVAVTGWVLELVTTGRVELKPTLPTPDVSELIRAAVAESLPTLIANALQTAPRPSGPFWTVESRLEELYPHWKTSPAQRHRIGQLAKRRVNQILNEAVSYFNRDLAFTAHQVYYLDRATDHVYRASVRAGEVQGFGLFADPPG